MENIEDKFAKRVVSYLGKEPAVSADIATRLEFARNTAIKAAMLKKAPKQKKKYFAFDFFKNKIVWATGAALALVIVGTSSDISFMTQTSSYTDEISYHVEADTIPTEFYSDEI
jgi:hypothetical protein